MIINFDLNSKSFSITEEDKPVLIRENNKMLSEFDLVGKSLEEATSLCEKEGSLLFCMEKDGNKFDMPAYDFTTRRFLVRVKDGKIFSLRREN